MRTFQLFIVLVLLAFGQALAIPVQAQQHPGMGLVPSPRVALARLPHIQLEDLDRTKRPVRVDLRETGYLPPVASQGAQGSCVGWATAYYCYTYARAKREQRPAALIAEQQFEYSPAFIYNRPFRHWSTPYEKEYADTGMSIFEAVQALRDKGCATLMEMPYRVEDASRMPDEAVLAKARERHARDIYPFDGKNVEDLKGFLAEAQCPVVLAIPVFEDFYHAYRMPEIYVYQHSAGTERSMGGHAVTVVGYDDAKHAFLIVNSWGVDWGNRGFLWLSEDFVRDFATERWGVLAGGDIAMGPVLKPVRVRGTAHLLLAPPK